jgi:hypothetical protein
MARQARGSLLEVAFFNRELAQRRLDLTDLARDRHSLDYNPIFELGFCGPVICLIFCSRIMGRPVEAQHRVRELQTCDRRVLAARSGGIMP